MRISDWSSDVCSSDLGVGSRAGASVAGGGGDRRAAGGHSPAVPLRRPGGGRRRRLSLGSGLLGLLTACWVRRTRRTKQTPTTGNKKGRPWPPFSFRCWRPPSLASILVRRTEAVELAAQCPTLDLADRPIAALR